MSWYLLCKTDPCCPALPVSELQFHRGRRLDWSRKRSYLTCFLTSCVCLCFSDHEWRQTLWLKPLRPLRDTMTLAVGADRVPLISLCPSSLHFSALLIEQLYLVSAFCWKCGFSHTGRSHNWYSSIYICVCSVLMSFLQQKDRQITCCVLPGRWRSLTGFDLFQTWDRVRWWRCESGWQNLWMPCSMDTLIWVNITFV